MKTQIAKMALVALMSTGSLLSADINYKSYQAGVSQASIADESNIAYTVGYGFAKTWESNVYAGVTINFDILPVEETTNYGYGGDFKLGYAPLNNLALYGIVAANMQSYGGGTGYGFGFGGGVDYVVAEHFGVSAEYTTATMSLEGLVDYDYSKATLFLKYLW